MSLRETPAGLRAAQVNLCTLGAYVQCGSTTVHGDADDHRETDQFIGALPDTRDLVIWTLEGIWEVREGPGVGGGGA